MSIILSRESSIQIAKSSQPPNSSVPSTTNSRYKAVCALISFFLSSLSKYNVQTVSWPVDGSDVGIALGAEDGRHVLSTPAASGALVGRLVGYTVGADVGKLDGEPVG